MRYLVSVLPAGDRAQHRCTAEHRNSKTAAKIIFYHPKSSLTCCDLLLLSLCSIVDCYVSAPVNRESFTGSHFNGTTFCNIIFADQ